VGDHWEPQSANTFCPKVFSAIKKPKGTLETRTIVVPLARSRDDTRTKIKPTNLAAWPDDERRRLIDDLWTLALSNLTKMHTNWDEATRKANLAGRNIDPWLGVLAVAGFIENDGINGLFQRMERLSLRYQHERADAEADDPERLLILALDRMYNQKSAPEMVFAPSELTDTMNDLAVEQDLGKGFISPEKVASLLKQMRRFQKLKRDNKVARWKVTRGDLMDMAKGYAMTLDGQQSGGGYPMVPPGTEEQDLPRLGECDDCRNGRSECTGLARGGFVGLSPFNAELLKFISAKD
jgi:hypothetical protein